MKKYSNDYALYKGDKFIDLGSKAKLARILGVKISTIVFYMSPTYRKRHKDPRNATSVFRIEA